MEIAMDYMTFINEKLWSGDIEANIKIPPGLFSTKPANEIAQYFFDLDQKDKTNLAKVRINLYLQRQGSNLDDNEKGKIRHAMSIVDQLRKQLHKKQSQSQ